MFSLLLPFDFLIWFLVVLLLLYFWSVSTFSYWSSRNVSSIPPEPLFGNIRDVITFKTSHHEQFQKFYYHFKSMGEGFGGVYQMREPVVVVCSPELVKHFLIKDFNCFSDRGISYDEKNDPLTAHLLNLDGMKWKRLRNKLTPSFSTGKLKWMFDVVKECGESLTEYLEKVESSDGVEIREILAKFTTDVIGSCAFGIQFRSLQEKDSTFREMGRKLMRPSYVTKLKHLTRIVFPSLFRKLKIRQVSQETTDFFTKVVKEVIEYRDENGIVRNDFLQLLIELKNTHDENSKDDDEKLELTDPVLAAQAFVFFVAGFETSSTTMSFCLHELANNPEIQDKMEEEIRDVFKKHPEISYDALQDLIYMDQTISETLRKYPPGPSLLRKCTQNYRIPGTKVVLEPGTGVIIPVFAFHNDPQLFPDPEKFDPGRFSEDNKKNIIQHSYFPFGEGPRTCIGLRFALMEMKLGLVRILNKYRIEKCQKSTALTFDPRGITLTPKEGIWLKLNRRKEELNTISTSSQR